MTDEQAVELDPKQRRELWKQHLELWQQSGLSQSAYCRQNDLKPHQFTYWKNRLVQTDRAITFVPLQLAHHLPAPGTKSGLNLYTPNGHMIEVAIGFDSATLKQLVHIVQSL